MPFSRRELLKISGIALATTILPETVYAQKMVVLPIPPLLDASHGQPIFLSMQRCRWTFVNGKPVISRGFNGRYLGPTIRAVTGGYVKLICSNHLLDPVAMTISGLQVPGNILGNARRQIRSGENWSPIFRIEQAAFNGWYHAITPRKMAKQIYDGLAGMWIVEDEHSVKLGLPNRYGVDDIPIIIQDKLFDSLGNLDYTRASKNGFLGNRLVTNGVESPFLNVAKGWVRLRLLNASSSRRYLLYLNNNRSFCLIGNEMGLLNAPVMKKILFIAPGERRDVLIDMSQDTSVSIMTGQRQNFLQRMKGIFESSNQLAIQSILTLQASGVSMNSVELPTKLGNNQVNISEISDNRQFVLDAGSPTINGAVWDQVRIDFQVKFGGIERWIIQAKVPQAFHVQGVVFIVKRVNGSLPEAEESGFKDTVWVENEVELLVHFNQRSSLNYPFLYYSQNLDRADAGAMGQFVVI